MSTTHPFIGRGIRFPMQVDASGSIALSEGHDEIVESIRLILGTAPGERPMRPAFGCAIHDYVFAPAGPTTQARIASEVRAAIERWEPRIELDSVTVTRDADSESLLLIEITYTPRSTNDARNLVFPFYVIPGATS